MQKDFSYPLTVADMPLSIQNYKIVAKPKDLTLLAQILKVEDVKELKADINLKVNREKHLLEVWGHIIAELVLKSVVSLEDFNQKYDFDFSIVFDTKATLKSQKEEEHDWDEDVPDIILDGKIDLVNIAIEQVALQIDDYPRKAGEVFEFKAEFSEDDIVKNNPFEVLAKLKK